MNTVTRGITCSRKDASESDPSSSSASASVLWQLAIKGTPVFGYSLRSAHEREARRTLESTVCRSPSQIQVLMVGHLEIAGCYCFPSGGCTDPETVFSPQSSLSIPSRPSRWGRGASNAPATPRRPAFRITVL